jgi:cation diffusion facilitator family transporter
MTSRKREVDKLRAEAVRFAGLTLAIDALMAAFKVGIGVFSGSHALLVGALYSVNDVLSSVAVAVSLRVGHKHPTDEYPYGYGKAEFIAVGMVSLAISLGVMLMFVFSMTDILKGVAAPPHFTAVFLAAIGMAVSWTLAHKSQKLAEALRSPALATSAEHHHADAHGSLLAIIGIVGAIMGLHVLDRVVAAVESLHLVAVSGTLLAKAVNGLMDRALPDEDTEMLENACGDVDGVRRVAHVRSRCVGSQTWIDVAVVVAPKLTVLQAKGICARVEEVVHGTVGRTAVTQVRFQGPRFVMLEPGPGGSGHA